MGTDNVVFLEVIEWFDESGKELVHRIPETGSGEIKWGAQMTVRESQAAVFFYNGKAYDAFGPGRHTLKTANIPLLTKILSLPWGMTSPLRAEVYFTNMKVFPNLTWGTRNPVAFRDRELGLIRLRAFGVFDDLNKLLKMKAAMALESAAQAQGEAGAGLGMGMGIMMPAMFAEAFRGGSAQTAPTEVFPCPDCRLPVQKEAKFCPHCGHQLLIWGHLAARCPHIG